MDTAAPSTSSRTPCGIYVHVPFCRVRCAFCAFYLEVHQDARVEQYLSAMRMEVEWYARSEPFIALPIQSLYLGGGTPTTLTADQLDRLLTHLHDCFHISPRAEITIEAHPETLTPTLLERCRAIGITRLSLGAESFDHGELLRVGRPAAVEAAGSAVRSAQRAGFSNINLDLMYGLPGQTLDSWLHTLDQALALSPTHLACYALTVEDGTGLADQVKTGRRPTPDPAQQTEFELAAEATLQQAGFRRYEVSNYARAGYECRHNLLYWQDGQYLGLGPSAQSYVGGVRFGNVADLDRYAGLLAEGSTPLDFREGLSPERRQREALVFGLRHIQGVHRSLVDHLSADQRWRDTLDRLILEGFLELSDDRLRLSPSGRQLADSVSIELL